jgi:hypothetical protein
MKAVESIIAGWLVSVVTEPVNLAHALRHPVFTFMLLRRACQAAEAGVSPEVFRRQALTFMNEVWDEVEGSDSDGPTPQGTSWPAPLLKIVPRKLRRA